MYLILHSLLVVRFGASFYSHFMCLKLKDCAAYLNCLITDNITAAGGLGWTSHEVLTTTRPTVTIDTNTDLMM